MLEKLSSVLKKTTDKIANAIFLDKALVDSVVKELQRALIEADVNVQLVLEISKKIKQAALDERISGIEKKEHIIKLLYDTLTSILGEKREIKLEDKNTWLLLGLYGQGKCVHAKSKIQLSDGNIIKIKELYEKYNSIASKKKLKEGEIIELNEKIEVPSFNPITLKIENKKITHLWKLKKKEMYEIFLDNGNDFSIKVTPEHPFFVLRNGEVIQIRADKILESDYIATPNKIEINGNIISLCNKLKKLPLKLQLSKEEADLIIKNQCKTIKEINNNLTHKFNYSFLTSNLKKGIVPVEITNQLSNIIISKENKSKNYITIPTYLTSDFAEFLGYVMGDGHIEQKYVQISNEDPEIINRVTELSLILFNIKPKVNYEKRTKKMYDIRICSSTLVKILSIFNLYPGKKGKELKIPEEILLSCNDVIKTFVRAYFDCDSSPSKDRIIELTSESQILIQQMHMLLKRFEIFSTLSKKHINSIPYFRLCIRSRYAEKYAEKIGYIIEHKRKKVNNYNKIGLIQGCGKQDMIPMGKALKEFRQSLGFSIGEIQSNAVYSYGRYEEMGFISKEKLKLLANYLSIKKKGIYYQLLDDINHKVDIEKKYENAFINGIKNRLIGNELIDSNIEKISLSGHRYLQKVRLENPEKRTFIMHSLAESDVCWLSIKKINQIKNDEEFVYDLTIEDNHSFIAEGFIVHNTTTIGKLASYYSKRGNKVCAIGLDIHRPAASEQLKQVCDKINVPCFISPELKDPKKIWKKFENELKKFNLILVDTAGRDALSEELIKEIKEISKLAKPTETFLIMSADVGQAAKKQAEAFKKACNVTGVIITKMDSTAKAGGALTACAEVKAPVIFIGTGEKPSDLETFDSETFLSRLLGMGDLKSLMDKIKSVVDKDKIEEQQKRLQEGKFTLRDLQQQLESLNSMGSMDKLVSMIPGLGKAKIPEGAMETQQHKMKHWKNAINSMTNEEIENPEILEKQTSRMQRISKGSGVPVSDIRALIKQYRLLKEMIASPNSFKEGNLDNKAMMKLAKKFAGKIKI